MTTQTKLERTEEGAVASNDQLDERTFEGFTSLSWHWIKFKNELPRPMEYSPTSRTWADPYSPYHDRTPQELREHAQYIAPCLCPAHPVV